MWLVVRLTFGQLSSFSCRKTNLRSARRRFRSGFQLRKSVSMIRQQVFLESNDLAARLCFSPGIDSIFPTALVVFCSSSAGARVTDFLHQLFACPMPYSKLNKHQKHAWFLGIQMCHLSFLKNSKPCKTSKTSYKKGKAPSPSPLVGCHRGHRKIGRLVGHVLAAALVVGSWWLPNSQGHRIMGSCSSSDDLLAHVVPFNPMLEVMSVLVFTKGSGKCSGCTG